MSSQFGSGSNVAKVPSTKPYLMRALYQWCIDHGFTPYISVFVDQSVDVPREYVKKDEIVLNIGPQACESVDITQEAITCKARFNGVPQHMYIPITHVMAIYSQENSQGMSFPVHIAQTSEGNPDPEAIEASKEITKSHIKLVK